MLQQECTLAQNTCFTCKGSVVSPMFNVIKE